MELQLINDNSIQPIIDAIMNQTGHLSFSSLKAFAESPSRFVEYKLAKREPTDAMIFGSMLHCLVLEPDQFEDRYLMLDDSEIIAQIGGAKPRATNKYKEWLQITMLEAGERKIVSSGDATAAKIISSNVRHNRASRKVLDLCPLHEVPKEWEFMNFLFHGFIDGDGEKAVCDLKTTSDAEPGKFQREIINQKYYLQAAMYLYAKGMEVPYYIIAVDKTGGVSVHKLEGKLIEQGMTDYQNLLTRFNECILKDDWDKSFDFWSDRYDGTFVCEKPTWMY